MKLLLDICFLLLALQYWTNQADCALSRPQRQTILNVINNLRRRVAIGDFSEFPPSANMRVIEWDDRLEAQARLKNGVTRCGAEQMTALSRTIPFKPYPLVGYVVALGTGRPVNMSTLLNKWLIERKEYHFNLTWDCNNLSCKNFLQLIWAETAFVGCSHNENCDNGRLVCYFAEGAPRRIQVLPYIEGVPCSRCSPELTHCMAKSLCSTKRVCEITQSQCGCDITARLCAHGSFDEHACNCTCDSGWTGARCNAPCSDRRRDCHMFRSQGACRWDALEWRHMERECRETCGHCDGSINVDEFHTNLEQILPNAGFPLFRVREPQASGGSRPIAMAKAAQYYRPPTRRPAYPRRRPAARYTTPRPPVYHRRPTTARASDYDLGYRSDIPWTKQFHHVDGYEQLAGNCRGSLLPEQSCVYCTLHDCAAACTRTRTCVGFSYILDENRCLLKSKRCMEPEPSGRVHYYDKAAPSAPIRVSHDDGQASDKYYQEISVDDGSVDHRLFPVIPGYNLLSGNCPGAVVPDGGCSNCTVDYCSLLCSATARCAGFSFVSQTRLCYLKWQTCDRPFPNEFTKFYQKMPGQPSFKLIDGYTLLTGYCDPISNTTTHCQPCGIDECKERCNSRTDCAGFTYYINEEKCDLLSTTCRDHITSNMQRVYVKLDFRTSTTIPDRLTTLFTTPSTQPPTTTTTTQTTSSTGIPTTAVWFKPMDGYKQLAGNCFGSVLDEQGCDNCAIEECALRCSLLPLCSGFTYVLATRQCLPKSEACQSPAPTDDVKFYVKADLVTTTTAPQETTTLPTWAPDPETTTTEPWTPDPWTPEPWTPPPETSTDYPYPQTTTQSAASFTVDAIYTLLPQPRSRHKMHPTPRMSRKSAMKQKKPRQPSKTTEPSVTVGPQNIFFTESAEILPVVRFSPYKGRGASEAHSSRRRIPSPKFRNHTSIAKRPAMPWLSRTGAVKRRPPHRAPTGSRGKPSKVLGPIRIHNNHDFSRQPGSLEVSNKGPMQNESFWQVAKVIPRSKSSETFSLKVPGYRLLPGNCYGNILSEGGCVDCSATECARRCDSLPGCGGFTYIPYQLRRCIPKSGTCSNPTVNEQIRFYERDSIVPTLNPVARARGRHMPRAMASRTSVTEFKPSGIFFDYHPVERGRSSLFSRTSRRGGLRSMFGGHGHYGHYYSHEHSHSHEQEELEMYASTLPTTTPPPTPPPPISDYAPPSLLDCRFSSVQLPQLSCQACSVDDCAANCRSSPNCVGFTFVVPESTCLPVATNCNTPSPDANIVFYSRLGLPPSPEPETTTQPGGLTTWFPTPRGFQELPGQNCWSGTIPQGECMPCSSDQCSETCRQMADCVGFTYILAQQHCLPKSQACNLDSSSDVNLRFYQRLDGPPIVTNAPPTTSEAPFTDLPITSTVSPTNPNAPYNPQPQADAILTTRQICYNTVAQLSCGGPFGSRSNDVIKIVQAHFGRVSYPNEMTCGQQNPVDDGAIEADCGFFDVKPFVSSLCNDKSNCSVFASNNILGNCQKLNLVCPLRSLYLEVTFMCISSIDHCSVISSEIPAGITFAASSSARMGAPAKPRSTCPGAFGASCDPSHALFTSSAMQAWCPSECDKNDGFIQIDLGAPYQISALVLQGRRRWDHWISRYYITFSANGHTWQQLEDQPASPTLLDGNWDARSVVIRRFPSPSPLSAVRYLRLHIANYVGYPAVHVDVVRCPDVVGCTPLTVAHSNATGVFAVYGQSVIVQCDRRFVTPVSRLSLFSAACLPTGEWSRTEQCLLATNCGEFPRVDNALHDGQSAEIGRRLMFTCNPGYRLVGNPMVTCQPSGLWSDLPSCAPTNAIV